MIASDDPISDDIIEEHDIMPRSPGRGVKTKTTAEVGGIGWSRLERYKFAGKVDMNLGSSPLY